MAKVVLTAELPDAEIAAAIRQVDHVLSRHRGRGDPLAIANLAALRTHLTRAASELQTFNRRACTARIPAAQGRERLAR